MEMLVKMSWVVLLAVHVPPAVVVFLPSLTERLYDLSPTGDAGILIVHRGALFLSIVVASGFALFDPAARRALSLVVAISIVGFLIVYVRSGLPTGALRTIAIADAVAVVPLAIVLFAAWR